jgi:hypothetical protein
MGCSCRTFREEPLARVMCSRSGAPSDEGSRDPPDLSLPLDCYTRAGFSSDEPVEKLPLAAMAAITR